MVVLNRLTSYSEILKSLRINNLDFGNPDALVPFGRARK